MVQLLGSVLLRGDLVCLNRVTREDLPVIAQMEADIGSLRDLSRRPAYPAAIEDIENWYQHQGERDEPAFAIRTLSDNLFIGICAFQNLRWQARHTRFWMGIGDPQMRGLGYGSDATRILLRYAFLELNLNCMALEIPSDNEAAMATYRKVGFKHDGIARAYLYRDGQYHDMHLMSMLRQEWDDLYGDGSLRP